MGLPVGVLDLRTWTFGPTIGTHGLTILQSRNGYSTWDSTVDFWTKP
jgi:hypothetical protein